LTFSGVKTFISPRSAKAKKRAHFAARSLYGIIFHENAEIATVGGITQLKE
jgi:hypothetical protein